jgi:carnosine N-methyltransferase
MAFAQQNPEDTGYHGTSMDHDPPDDAHSWAGEFDPFADAEERRVLFATLDSFR